ncbi:Nitroreductase [Nocardioides terrae]|uniref:Nitroreductase n=1 Tax=Nocardioides terrae TaxID=574651 RepID=A0A1I1MJQ4_9ACTN|nr:nitroreductase family protein [Nocardioides terrae]SFC85649.1 Nitroreductase [Nocardioides terrae]
MRQFEVDARRYHRYSIPGGGNERFDTMTGMQLDAASTRHSHRVEKGFSLPETKRPFGVRATPALNRALANADAADDALFVTEAKEVLEALEQWNENGVLDERIAPRGDALPVNPLDPETLATFITSRHSIRDFDQRPVDRALVTEAVRLATYSPSVCNRQGFRAYYFDDRADIDRILEIHDGSRGFGSRVPGLFIVTWDIRAFETALERNQGWIDGGLFSMTLLLALHGLGLGAVPLNWSRLNAATDELRERAALPDHENVVMLIAAGHPAEGYRVARSTRRPMSQILRFGMPAD